jgi:hypothetical protein
MKEARSLAREEKVSKTKKNVHSNTSKKKGQDDLIILFYYRVVVCKKKKIACLFANGPFVRVYCSFSNPGKIMNKV